MQLNYSASNLYQMTGVTVEKAADYFSVSTRRIRKLLGDGRLAGTKNGKAWHVSYPYQYIIGTRGPHLLLKRNHGNSVRPYKPKLKRNTSKRSTFQKKQEV